VYVMLSMATHTRASSVGATLMDEQQEKRRAETQGEECSLGAPAGFAAASGAGASSSEDAAAAAAAAAARPAASDGGAPPTANGQAHAAALPGVAPGIEGEDSLARFLMACAYIRYGGIAKQLGAGVSIGTDLQLRLYGLYRQATRGPCTDPAPSLFRAAARAKWAAWNQLGTMPRQEACDKYVASLESIGER